MQRRKRMIIMVVCGIIIITGLLLFVSANQSPPINVNAYDELVVTCLAFVDGIIPVEFTGNSEDKSPELALENLSHNAVSVAVIMDDLDHPIKRFNHWTIWNIPPSNAIPEEISHGASVAELGGAMQGIGYGRHCYRGPKPPFGSHRYQFHVFVLDTMLDLKAASRKKDLLTAMQGHILQYGSVTGSYPGEKQNSKKLPI